MKILVSITPSDETKPSQAIRDGLKAAGHDVMVCEEDVPIAIYDALVVWNGYKPRHYTTVSAFQKAGKPIVFLERGFFNRMHYTQADTRGWNYWASWRDELFGESPERGKFRLEAFTPMPMSVRDGYILVLCQTSDDVQIMRSGINALALPQLVVDNAPPDMQVRVRPHPQTRMEGDVVLEGSLHDALDDAAFVVTINSNSGNDALLAGVPVLAFGPALYVHAGLAMHTTLQTLRHGLLCMSQGWHPHKYAVQNYLEHLAARQYSDEELPTVILRLVEGDQ